MSRPRSQAHTSNQTQTSNKQRGTTRLGEGLERRLLSYMVAASAAGVGVLACSSPAEAKIAYTAIWIEILPPARNGPPTLVNLDLNGDMIADFQFSNRFTTCTGTSCNSFRVLGVLNALPQNPNNGILGAGGTASALGSGVYVGPSGNFQQGHKFMAKGFYGCSRYGSCAKGSNGPWIEATRNFLGVRFVIQGEIHYGWVRLNVTTADSGVYAAVTGFAYETVPNQPIVTGQTKGAANKKQTSDVRPANPASLNPSAPEPGSLGLLAGGSLGLNARRTRDATLK
jgi:hypothetical protein